MSAVDHLANIPIVKEGNLESKLDKLSKKVQNEKRALLRTSTKQSPRDGSKLYKPATGAKKTGAAGNGERHIKTGNTEVKGGIIGKRKSNDAEGNGHVVSNKKPKRNVSSPFDKIDKTEKTDWKKLKYEQKQLKETRKKSKGVELFQLSKEVKIMWEELRQESCPKNRKISLSAEIYEKIKPFLKKIVFTHDMVRVVECLLAHSAKHTCDLIFAALKDDLLALSKDKYGHFLVLKMLKYGDKTQRKFIMSAFDGNVVRLIKNPFSMDVIELAYNDYANAEERSKLTQEFYGPEFRVLKDLTCRNLDEILQMSPFKREIILKNMKENLLKILPKGRWKATIMHTLMNEYLSNCDSESRTEMIELIKNDLVNILHTRDGARVAMNCLWHGNAKDRKLILKSFKTFVNKISTDEHGHMVLLALFDCVDDTLLVSKAILGELLESVGAEDSGNGDLLLNKYGRRVVLYLVAPRKKAFFHPDIVKVLEKGDDNKHSKKEVALRRQELHQFTIEKLLEKVQGKLSDYIKNSSSLVAVIAILDTTISMDLTNFFQSLAKAICDEAPRDCDDINIVVCLRHLITQDRLRSVTFTKILVDILVERHDVVRSWLKQYKMSRIFILMCTEKQCETQVTSLIKNTNGDDIMKEHLLKEELKLKENRKGKGQKFPRKTLA